MNARRSGQPLVLFCPSQLRICFNLAQPAGHCHPISSNLVHDDRRLSYLTCEEEADATVGNVERGGMAEELGVAVVSVLA